MSETYPKHPKALDRIAYRVLSYRAPARTKKAKKRQRARRKAQRESSIWFPTITSETDR